jgi:S1-C subfamily serine protease
MAAALAAALCACAQQPAAPPPDGPLPGSIGVLVRAQGEAVVIEAVREDSAAARIGLRPGDVVVRLNGESIASPRQFYRLVIDSPPGSEVTLDVMHDGKPAVYVLPVRQADTTPHA